MPAKGGPASKSGDLYELLWTIEAALRIVAGLAEYVVYESLDPEASRGVEHNLQTASGDLEFWSVKRQTTAAAGWTLATLVRADEHGRSILGDLAKHIDREDRRTAVFASMLGAPKLDEMRAVAATRDAFAKRLQQSVELKRDYEQYLLPLFGNDADRAFHFLKRLQIRTMDETSLRTQIESTITLLFYSEIGGSVDPAAVRRLLAEYLLDHMHQPIDRAMILGHLATHGIRRKDWKVDGTVLEKVDALCEAYTKPLREQFIGGILQDLPGAEKLLDANGIPRSRRVLVSGGAGGGKSSELAHLVERLRAAGIPTIPVRLDQIDESVMTPQRLGEALSLPASPVAVLAGLADGGECVLVIDQLDAVSLASGRRAEVWSLFEGLLTEADGYPNLRVITACREFDLEHDHRMRSLKAKSSVFEVIPLGSFDSKKLDDILGGRKAHPKLKPLLVVPLHLAMFLTLQAKESERLETRDELFAAFWTEKQQQTSRRLGRPCDFAGVIDRLAGWLSERQELSAPSYVLDDVRADADALTSEHVLVLADGRYRFFHETFFDYAFARRFARTSGHLLDLLLGGEQHLFRRAQVRQVLFFLRSNDPPRYLTELRSVLTDGRVRFHIKRVAFQFLAAVVGPTQREWELLRDLAEAEPDLRSHVHRVIAGHVGWFDTLDAAGFFEEGLSSGDTRKEEQVITLLAMSHILEQRSARVAALLSRHRRSGEEWKRYLQHVCRFGDVFHSREMFDLFVRLIQDGTLDGTRPGFATNDNWWHCLYSMAEKSSAMASEAIGAWFDRKLQAWRQDHPDPETPADEVEIETEEDTTEQPRAAAYLRQYLDADGGDHGVVSKAAQAPHAFVEHLLPRVADFIANHAEICSDRLDIDPLWSFRSYGDDEHRVHNSVFKALAHALERLARSSPVELDRLLDHYVGRPHDAISYLVLRAWSAAPEVYAERLAAYLAGDPRRFKIGYSGWSGRASAGMAGSYRSIEAVRVASPRCSPEAFAAMETAIVDLRDEWEAKHPQTRGLSQLQLLSAMDQGRLGPKGRAKLAELRAKFPDITHEPPEDTAAHFVGPPISDKAQERMTDAQWLSAMAKYAGVEYRYDRDPEASGGERQLARALEARTSADPKRFVGLSAKMPVSLPAAYFDAIITGVAATVPPDGSGDAAVSLSDIIALIERAHALPGRPCGRWIAYLVKKWSRVEWPATVVEVIAWYATNDPDPAEEVWRQAASSGQPYYGGDPDSAGLNSTRGASAGAVAELLFGNREPADVLVKAVDRLAHDPSIAVRSQAVVALLALLNTRPDLAIPWFIDCISLDPVLLGTPCIQRFIYYAGYRDYPAIRQVLQQMLSSADAETVQTGAQLCSLLALGVGAAEQDAEQLRVGSAEMREAAATIYATNVAHKEVGATCRDLLRPFFADAEDAVRATAAQAFRHISDLDTAEQGQLLAAFLDAGPSTAALEPVIRSLEDSPVKLPDLVCRLIEAGVDAFGTGAGDIRTAAAGIAMDLSKIVIRLYAQSEDETIRKRCLDAIDRMEQGSFLGMSDELGRLDR